MEKDDSKTEVKQTFVNKDNSDISNKREKVLNEKYNLIYQKREEKWRKKQMGFFKERKC